MVIGAMVDDRIAAQFSNARDVAIFIQNGLFVLATATFTIMGAHVTWALRRKVFETRTIGRYRLKKCLGRGGMGEVWLAYHTALKRDVAIKILNPPPGREKSAVARFEREVVALTELRHPNTVRVFDFGVTADGLRYYVMELLVGITLTELVETAGPLPVERAVPLVRQVAGALAEVHQKGMVHRDMKPDNLMIMTLPDGQEFVKVIDFGIARKEGGPNEEKLTMDGWIGGTPAFISPEAARGEPVGPPGDVYGVGGVLYYALTGRRPFGTGSAAATMYAHVFNMPKPPSQHVKTDIGEDIDQLVMRCLAKVAEERPRDGAELAMALCELQLPEGASVTDPYIVRSPKPADQELSFGDDATLSISEPGHFED
jgi:serine/threonine-protein kinase